MVWEAGSLDWCSLNLYLGGNLTESLTEAEKIVHKWGDKLRDEWDYTDISTGWDGYPWCNSHYSRQLIFWSIPLALSGQQWHAPTKTLTFNPHSDAPKLLPFFTPQADGLIESLAGGKWRLTVVSGNLQLNELIAVKEKKSGPISLSAGESIDF